MGEDDKTFGQLVDLGIIWLLRVFLVLDMKRMAFMDELTPGLIVLGLQAALAFRVRLFPRLYTAS